MDDQFYELSERHRLLADDIFLAGANWVSHKDLNTFDSDKLVSKSSKFRDQISRPGETLETRALIG